MKKSAKKLTKKFAYILRHTNLGCPEAGAIESVYANQKDANAAMKMMLEDFYQISVKENKESGYECMFVSKHPLYS